MDELTQDIGIELHTESIIHRAEQLARLESDKIVDKVSGYHDDANSARDARNALIARAKNTNFYYRCSVPFYYRMSMYILSIRYLNIRVLSSSSAFNSYFTKHCYA